MALYAFVRYAVCLAIFHKDGACLYEVECHIISLSWLG